MKQISKSYSKGELQQLPDAEKGADKMKLQDERKKAGLSQSQLAEKVGMNVRTLQHYEQGRKNFDHAHMDTILRTCIALNVTLDRVIEDATYVDLMNKYIKISKTT